MNSNVYSTEEASPPVQPIGLDQLEAAIQDLSAQDLHALPDGVAAARVLALRRLLDRLEGHWLRELAGVDGRGAAGSEADIQVLSTTSWLRNQLRLGAGAARRAVHTARALFRGPLAGTANALAAGEVSVAHAAVLAAGAADLPAHTTMEAEPVLLQAARRLDPHRLRRVVNHLRYVTDPDRAEQQQQRRFERRGVWLSPTWEGMLAVDGLLDPEAGQTLLAALEPLARPAGTDDERSGTQRNADALAELARRSLKHGSLPQSGGVRPHQPDRFTRPTQRPGGPRRRLRLPRLRPTPGLVRGPPPTPLGTRRAHRPGQPGPVVLGASSGRPRGRLAAAARPRRAADRHPATAMIAAVAAGA
jgi:Domain of unknown function (DUF222)